MMQYRVSSLHKFGWENSPSPPRPHTKSWYPKGRQAHSTVLKRKCNTAHTRVCLILLRRHNNVIYIAWPVVRYSLASPRATNVGTHAFSGDASAASPAFFMTETGTEKKHHVDVASSILKTKLSLRRGFRFQRTPLWEANKRETTYTVR